MLAITQGFLHKALEIHRGGHYLKHNYSTPGDFNFIVLPPNNSPETLYCFCFPLSPVCSSTLLTTSAAVDAADLSGPSISSLA